MPSEPTGGACGTAQECTHCRTATRLSAAPSPDPRHHAAVYSEPRQNRSSVQTMHRSGRPPRLQGQPQRQTAAMPPPLHPLFTPTSTRRLTFKKIACEEIRYQQGIAEGMRASSRASKSELSHRSGDGVGGGRATAARPTHTCITRSVKRARKHRARASGAEAGKGKRPPRSAWRLCLASFAPSCPRPPLPLRAPAPATDMYSNPSSARPP